MAKSTEDGGRRFPLIIHDVRRAFPDCPRSIPWQAIAPHEAQALKNHGGQSLEKLASRGGLSPREAYDIIQGQSGGTMKDDAAAVRFCQALNDNYERAQEAARNEPMPDEPPASSVPFWQGVRADADKGLRRAMDANPALRDFIHSQIPKEPEPMEKDVENRTPVNPVGAFCVGDMKAFCGDVLTAGYPPEVPLYVGFGDSATAGRESPLYAVRGLIMHGVRVHKDGEITRPSEPADDTHTALILLLKTDDAAHPAAYGIRLVLFPHTLFLLSQEDAARFLEACGLELAAPPVPLPDWKSFLLFLAREEKGREDAGQEPIKAIRTPLAPFALNSPAMAQTYHCSRVGVHHARSMESLRKMHGRRLWPGDATAERAR